MACILVLSWILQSANFNDSDAVDGEFTSNV